STVGEPSRVPTVPRAGSGSPAGTDSAVRDASADAGACTRTCSGTGAGAGGAVCGIGIGAGLPPPSTAAIRPRSRARVSARSAPRPGRWIDDTPVIAHTSSPSFGPAGPAVAGKTRPGSTVRRRIITGPTDTHRWEHLFDSLSRVKHRRSAGVNRPRSAVRTLFRTGRGIPAGPRRDLGP